MHRGAVGLNNEWCQASARLQTHAYKNITPSFRCFFFKRNKTQILYDIRSVMGNTKLYYEYTRVFYNLYDIMKFNKHNTFFRY